MTEVTQSPFLQALGYAIVNSLWQFALLWLIYVALNTLVRLSAHQKYSTGLVIQVAGFSWFVATFNYYWQQFLKLDEIYFFKQKSFPLALTSNNSLSFADKFLAGITQTENFLPYLSIIYLLVLFFLCFHWIKAYRVTKTIKTRGLKKIDVNWRLFVKQLSYQLGIKREVKIYLSEMVKTPLTIGFFKPMILVPLVSLNHLDTYQMEAVILHELAHIKRFDYLFNIFLALIDVTLFFNPFTALISRHIRRERENCCDDWVLQYNYNAAAYADALLQIATCQSSSLLALQASDTKYALLNRIKRMIEKKENTFFNYRYQIIAFFVMLIVAGSLAVMSSIHNMNKVASSSSQNWATAKQEADMVISPFFTPDFFWAPQKQNINKGNKVDVENNIGRNFRFHTLPTKDTSSIAFDRHKENFFPKIFSLKDKLLVHGQWKKPRAPAPPLSPGTEDFVNIAEQSFPAVDIQTGPLRKQELESEDQMKDFVTQLVEVNKSLYNVNKPIINQKELSALKIAIYQLKKVKIETGLASQRLLKEKQSQCNVQLPKWQDDKFFTQQEVDKMKKMREDVEMKMEEFRKQAMKLADGVSLYKQNFTIPKVIYSVPVQEKAHSFSFEIATDADVKVTTPPNFFFTPKKVKRKERTSTERVIENIDPQIAFPPTSGKSTERATRANRERSLEIGTKRDDDLLIIRI